MPYADIFIAFVLGTAILTLLRFAWRLLNYDKTEYQKSRARYPSVSAALRGQARVKRDSIPDGRIRAGIVYNKRESRIEPNGKLSNDTVDRILYPSK